MTHICKDQGRTIFLNQPFLQRTVLAAGFLALILSCSGGRNPAFAAAAQHPFAAMKADVDLDIEDGEFEIMINFTLAPGSNGIDPSAETVTLQVSGGKASFSVTIPPNSFKKQRNGDFTFQGTINRVRLQASIRTKRDGALEFETEGDRVNLKGVANPVTVSLVIGDDGGSSAGKAKIE